jgi:very-short-patch-repair endonuclease
VATLRALLAEVRGPAPATRSELERRFLDLCGEAGLPSPNVNVQVAGLEVDVLWPTQRLVVEVDGYAFHHDRATFERDRVRDATL